MEITSNSTQHIIPLVVGRRVAQIVFFDTEGTINDKGYKDDGKYQKNMNMEELKNTWDPMQLLPKLYEDREIFHINNTEKEFDHSENESNLI